jgi:hypothetical protein
MSITLREWIVIAVALLLSALLIGLNNWYGKNRSLQIATVDMSAVLKAKQKQVGDVLVREGATPEERKAAIESASAYASKVEGVLNEIMSTCRCVLVSKDLVVAGPSVQDHTLVVLDRLKGELGRSVQ